MTAERLTVGALLRSARSVSRGLGGALTSPVIRVAGRFDPGRRRRRTWAGEGRAHIEVRAVDRHDGNDVAAHVEKALTAVKGVRWAKVNPVLGRVVVALDGDGPSVDELVDVVESVEEAHGVDDETFPAERPEHPGDIEPIRRNAIALGADAAALGAGVFGQLLQVSPLPTELASIVSMAENDRRLRQFLEHRFGIGVTDLGLGISNAVAQAVAQGPVGLAVDMVHRTNQIGELVARRRAWERREPVLHSDPGADEVGPVTKEPRPAPLRSGPVESYIDRAALGSLAAFGGVLATTRQPRKAAAMLVAGLPKAARHGREAFAAHLGRELARRDVVVMDNTVLRRLDRIDVVLLDAEIVRAPGRGGPPGNGDVNDASPRADALNGSGDAAPAFDPMATPLVTAAHRGGMSVVLAGGSATLARVLGVDARLPGGRRLRSSVRRLQEDGSGVLLVSGGEAHGALESADCAVGVAGRGPRPPWGADILTGADLVSAHFLVEATAMARQVSGRAALLALAGSAVGGAWALTGAAPLAATRASLSMNLSALASQAQGVAAAAVVARRPDPAPRSEHPWYAMEPDQVLEALRTSEGGLSKEEVARRRARDRPVEPPGIVKVARAVGTELANPLTPLLAAGAGLSAAMGSLTDAGLVAGVTAVNTVIGAAQRLRADVSIERLTKATSAVVEAVRGGDTVPVRREDLVPGDIVSLRAGDAVPADCRVLAATSCEVDESSLTGESLPVSKFTAPTPRAAVAERSSMLYEGTTVSSGSVLAVVVAVGDQTEVGRSLADAPEPPPSGVEARLSTLTAATLPATVASGAAVTAIGLMRGRSPRRAVTSGVGLTVAAVPEGLPLLATTAQQAAAHRLATRGALVRNPRTIEALGRVDTLCFDKTGTLTVGEISLQLVSNGRSSEPVDRLGTRTRAVLAAALRASPDANGEEVEFLPHATDRAVVAGAQRAGVTPDEGIGEWEAVDELAFDSVRGFHAVVGRGPDGTRISVKGAPEVILPRCDAWYDGDRRVALGERTLRRMGEEVERLAGRGLRVLAVAERGASDRADFGDDRVTRMELLGFVGLADSVRPSAAQAVKDLRSAGVEVAMITGDHPSTAAAIARDLGILNGSRVLTGTELESMRDTELDAVLADVVVFARVTPKDKVRIVRAYQRAGRVVAMTGDGANDAPAIRLAHTGIALGDRSSAAAREAADLVVVDDRMETILDAIVEGRSMWVSVRDALAILVGGNLGEVAFSVTATAIAGASPLVARQFLLVNVLTDMLPAMAIALRRPAGTSPEILLQEGPDKSLGSALVGQIVLRASMTAAGATGAWLFARATGRRRRASTVALAALVGTQLGQTVVVGRDSPLVLVSAAASAAALVGIVQTPGVSQFFGCTPLGPVGWGIAAGSAAAATGASVVLPALAHRLGAPLPRAAA